MASLPYTNYPTFGQTLSDTTHYSQAVILPTTPRTIKVSGQGAWDPSTGSIPSSSEEDIKTHIDRAFANVELALKTAGAEQGWDGVYLVRMFYVVEGERGSEEWKGSLGEILQAGGEVLKKWCPGHRPLLTAVEVRGLALEGMRVEVEVEGLV